MRSLLPFVSLAMWLNRRGLRLVQIAGCWCSLAATSQATPVDWTNTLDATLLSRNCTVTYTNVNGEGYDIVVTTANLNAEGRGAIGGLMLPTTSWWFEGKIGSPGSCGTITFRFFETGTTNTIGINGVNFRLEDAEQYERFANFAYWDQFGALQDTLTNTDPVFSGSGGITTSLAPNILENRSPNSSGTQLGKTLEINLTSAPVSGFTFEVFRTKDAAGSVEMTGLGNLSIATPDTGSTLALLGGVCGVLAYLRRKVAA